MISLVASLGVILFGVLEGILIAIALSIFLFFRRSWWPEGEVLGRVRELDGWHRTDRFPTRRRSQGSSSTAGRRRCSSRTPASFASRSASLCGAGTPRWVVLQCEAITDIDVTAADMLDKLDKELNDKGINVVFVEMRSRIEDLLERYGLFATFTREHVYPSIDMALRGIEEEERRAPTVDPPEA